MKAFALTLFAMLALLPAAGAADELQAFNRFDAAKKVADILMQIAPDQQRFFVKEFRGIASNNIGLSKLVGDQLAKAGKTIESGAPIEVEGRLMRLPRDESKELTGFTIQGSVFLSGGSTRRFSVNVMNRDDGLSTVGDTGEASAPPNASPGTPPSVQPTIVESEVRASPDNPYGVEILVETSPGNYVPVTPRVVDDLMRVSLQPGAIYAVKLHNRTDFDAAVEVSIDGLSRFALADNPRFVNGRDLISPQSHRIITGYFRNEQLVDAFQIGEHSKSVAAQTLPNPQDIGTVTVTFAAAWERGTKPPPNEPDVAKNAPLGTIRGPQRVDPTVAVERDIGAIRAVVKVRY
ncbi:MAG: hypothetical protein KF861_01230 [Planctomycetaceae bacterium]|nr:hypothetical protein [Planctomycetaceae bacterium]